MSHNLCLPSKAFLIALTSDFIPRMYYLIVESPIYSFEGYVNSTLAVFDTADWGNPSNTTGTDHGQMFEEIGKVDLYLFGW